MTDFLGDDSLHH